MKRSSSIRKLRPYIYPRLYQKKQPEILNRYLSYQTFNSRKFLSVFIQVLSSLHPILSKLYQWYTVGVKNTQYLVNEQFFKKRGNIFVYRC